MNFLKPADLKQNREKAKWNFLGQSTWEKAIFLKFSPKKTNLVNLLLINKQFYQLADAIIVSAAIATDLRNLISWINYKIVVSQPQCQMDVITRKHTKIVKLHKHTAKTCREIAALVGTSLAAVSRVIKLKQDTGSVSPKCKGKCGRKKKITSGDNVTYSDKVKKIPAIRATHRIRVWRIRIFKSFPLQFAVVSCQLDEKSEDQWQKQLFIKAMKKKRYTWAKKYKDWTN